MGSYSVKRFTLGVIVIFLSECPVAFGVTMSDVSAGLLTQPIVDAIPKDQINLRLFRNSMKSVKGNEDDIFSGLIYHVWSTELPIKETILKRISILDHIAYHISNRKNLKSSDIKDALTKIKTLRNDLRIYETGRDSQFEPRELKIVDQKIKTDALEVKNALLELVKKEQQLREVRDQKRAAKEAIQRENALLEEIREIDASIAEFVLVEMGDVGEMEGVDGAIEYQNGPASSTFSFPKLKAFGRYIEKLTSRKSQSSNSQPAQ